MYFKDNIFLDVACMMYSLVHIYVGLQVNDISYMYAYIYLLSKASYTYID